MHVLRASTRHLSSSIQRNFVNSARYARPQLLRQQVNSSQRSYASAVDTVKQKASSDMPWLITALAVTVPAVYYVLRPSADAEHGEHGDHGHHASEHHDEDSDKAEDDSASAEQAEKPTKSEDKDSKNDDKESKDEGSSDDQTSEGGDGSTDDADSGKSRATKVEGVNFAGGTLKRESDAKGGVKKRIDSDLGKNIGEGSSSGEGDDMSNKQRGYSNTDTRHSVDISKDSGKSKKGEGTAETAKIKGTVDGGNRPQV